MTKEVHAMVTDERNHADFITKNTMIDSIAKEVEEDSEIIPEASQEMINDLWNEAQKCWRESRCRKVLQEKLEDHTPRGGWKIEKCILIGLGTIATGGRMTLNIHPHERANTSIRLARLTQLAIFLDIGELGKLTFYTLTWFS